MKTKNLIVATFVLFIFQISFAQNAERMLTRDIMTSSKTLKNEMKIYNYFTMQQVWDGLKTVEGRQASVQAYLSQRAGSFWDFDFTDNSPKNYANGAALYFAIDPHISQTFGNVFIELTVPAGTRFINVVSPITLKKDTLAALVSEGIINQSDIPMLFPKRTGFYRDTLRMMVLPEYRNFRTVVQNIFEAQGIQFVEYNFNSSLTGFCTKHSYSAFAYVGLRNHADPKKAIVDTPFSNVNMYSAVLDFPEKSASEENEMNSILKFRNVLEEIKGKKNKKEYILSQYSPQEYQQIKTRTFSCDQ